MREVTCPYHCNHGKIFNTFTKEYQPCPHCASILEDLSKNYTEAIDEADVSKFDLFGKLNIPEQYRNVRFNPDTFFTPKAGEIFARNTFGAVIEQLSAVNTAIMNSHILLESSYFYTGMYSRILDFVFDCLISAVKHGLTAVPYISLKDLQGIRNNTEQMAHLYSNITWYDYTSADICFVGATGSADNTEAVILADLLHERARRGLPTYCIGYWASDTLAQHKSGLYYLIDKDADQLHLLKPYEIQTLFKYSKTGGDVLGSIGTVGSIGLVEDKPVRESAYGLGVSLEKYRES